MITVLTNSSLLPDGAIGMNEFGKGFRTEGHARGYIKRMHNWEKENWFIVLETDGRYFVYSTGRTQ